VKKNELGAAISGNQLDSSIPMQIYKMTVETRIKDNWAFPAALINSEAQKKIEAIMVLMVKRDGTILKSWFKKRTANAIFDESVLKAIKRSNPLPPFPEGYNKSYDDIEISFNLDALVNQHGWN